MLLSPELKEEKIREFLTIKQDSLSMHEYAQETVKDIRSRMSLFVARLGHSSSKEGTTVILIGNTDISSLMVYV